MYRRYRTPEQRSESARKAAATRKARQAAQAAADVASGIVNKTPAVGDFFEESWGYDQTNVDFYQVVKVSASGKSVVLRHVKNAQVDADRNITHVAPVADGFHDEWTTASRKGDLRKTLRWARGEPYVSMTSYSHAYLWDGKPAYQTASGWGH